jgi:hypothetical protein
MSISGPIFDSAPEGTLGIPAFAGPRLDETSNATMNKAKMNSVTKIAAALDFEVRVGFRSAGALRCVIADTSNLLPQYAQKIAVDRFPLAQLGQFIR